MHAGEEMPLTSLGTPMGEALIEMSRKGFGVVGVVDGAGRSRGSSPTATSGVTWRASSSGRSTR